MGDFVDRPEIEWPVRGGWAEGACFDLRNALAATNVNVATLDGRLDALEPRVDAIEANSALYPAFGGMFETNEAGTNITVTTGGNPSGTFYGWTTATAGLADASGRMVFEGNATADRLKIGAGGAGTYQVSAHICCTGTANREVQCAIHKNNTRDDKLRADAKLNAGGDDMTVAFIGFVAMAVGDFIDLRFSANQNGTTVTIKHLNLNLVRVA